MLKLSRFSRLMSLRQGGPVDYVVSKQNWFFITRHLSKPKVEKCKGGRPRAPDRDIYEAIMWLLNSGARWQDLPDHFPAKSSCHRRFQQWSRDGSWQRLQKALVRKLSKKKKLNLEESFIDGSLIQAKKGVLASAKAGKLRAQN